LVAPTVPGRARDWGAAASLFNGRLDASQHAAVRHPTASQFAELFEPGLHLGDLGLLGRDDVLGHGDHSGFWPSSISVLAIVMAPYARAGGLDPALSGARSIAAKHVPGCRPETADPPSAVGHPSGH